MVHVEIHNTFKTSEMAKLIFHLYANTTHLQWTTPEDKVQMTTYGYAANAKQ